MPERQVNQEADDPSVDPHRVAWPPVEPANPRFTRPSPEHNKITMIGDLQVTEISTNTGRLIMHAVHVPTGTSLSVWAKEGETLSMVKVRIVRMMAAALRKAGADG